jgi:putative transposase
VVEKDEYAKELSRYIRLNPVRAKMVGTPEEYDWSSYKYYIGREKTPARVSSFKKRIRITSEVES